MADPTVRGDAVLARHPVLVYFVLAYACSWIVAIPLALSAQGVFEARLPLALHYVTGLGPAVAALVTTRLLRHLQTGPARSRESGRARQSGRWLAVGALSPLALFMVAQAAADLSGQPVPSWTALGDVNFLPPLGLWAWALWLVTNGWGEELGWRGFALPRLQRTHSALASSILLSIAWAGWHLPAFFYVPTYVGLGPGVLPGFALGILAGAIVLTWLYNSSHGSVFSVALWHASFNFVSAAPATGGFAAAATSTLVMVWAVVIVWRYRSATLAAAPKHVTPGGLLAVGRA